MTRWILAGLLVFCTTDCFSEPRTWPPEVTKAVNDLASEDRAVSRKAIAALAEMKTVPPDAIAAILGYLDRESSAIVESRKPPNNDKSATKTPLVGDETMLLKIQADPASYAGKLFTICGLVRIADIYPDDHPYTEYRYYTMTFFEVDERVHINEVTARLYLRRGVFGFARDRCASLQLAGYDGMLVRIVGTIRPSWYRDNKSANAIEVLDIQFLNDNKDGWQLPSLGCYWDAMRAFRKTGREGVPQLVATLQAPALGIDDVLTYSVILVAMNGMDRRARQSASARVYKLIDRRSKPKDLDDARHRKWLLEARERLQESNRKDGPAMDLLEVLDNLP